MAVGMLPRSLYDNNEIMLNAGDSLVMVTDGITDAHNAQGEMFGYNRVIASISDGAVGANAQEIMMALIANVNSFASSTEQFDDIGVLVVSYKATGIG